MKVLRRIAAQLRVYEYVDGEGNTFWSMTKFPATVSAPRRLVIQNRVGEHPLHFVGRFRQLVQAIRFEETSVEDDG